MAIPKINTGVGVNAFDKLALLGVYICKRTDWTTKAQLVDTTTTILWKDLGQAKTGEGANLETTSETVPILTLESGNTPHAQIISDVGFKATVTLAQVNQEVREAVTDYWTAEGIENAIGDLSTIFSVRFHPSENGTDYSKDIIIPSCSIKATETKASELGQYSTLKLEITAMFDSVLTSSNGKPLLVLTDLT